MAGVLIAGGAAALLVRAGDPVERQFFAGVASIERRTVCKRRFRVRLEEGIEDRLFAACDRLNVTVEIQVRTPKTIEAAPIEKPTGD